MANTRKGNRPGAGFWVWGGKSVKIVMVFALGVRAIGIQLSGWRSGLWALYKPGLRRLVDLKNQGIELIRRAEVQKLT